MPRTATTGSTGLTTTGATAATGILVLTLDQSDNLAVVGVSGTYGTVTFVFEGTVDDTNWFPVAAVLMTDQSVVTGTVSPSDNTAYAWRVPCAGCAQVRLRVTAINSGAFVVTMGSSAQVSNIGFSGTTSTAALTSATTITSASATALAVGPGGTTNPSLQVDASTGSAITGLKIKSAASGAGVAITSLGGSNELITIDTKGSGTLGINSINTSAGLVTLGNSTNVCGLTLIGPFTVNSSINQNVAMNGGTSTGSFTVGNTSAGAFSIQGASASLVKTTGANLTIGTLSSGTTAIVSAGLLTLTGVGGSVWTPGAGATVVSDASSGITFATATTQKLGFFNATPVVQGAASTNSATGTTGASTGCSIDTTFTGGSGATAYTISGIVLRLKQFGFLAA